MVRKSAENDLFGYLQKWYEITGKKKCDNQYNPYFSYFDDSIFYYSHSPFLRKPSNILEKMH